MTTLQDVINEISKVREAIDGLEVRGKNNATLLCYAYGKCDEIINELAETANQIQNGSVNDTEVDDEHGEVNTKSS